MEIRKIKFEYLAAASILVSGLMLCACVGIAGADNLEPLDLLDSNVPDINDIADVNDANDANLSPMDLVDTAQANLVAKMDGSAGLQQELKNLIGQISTIQFKNKEEPQSEAQPVADQNITTETSQSQEKQENLVSAEAAKTINPQAQYENNVSIDKSKLDELVANPNDVSTPLELADVLYKCGKLKEAAVFYQRAYDSANSDISYKDKSWILFQAGNCLQKENPQEAVKIYRKLIIEYPDSFWADAAKAKDRLVEWYIEQKPDTLLKKHK